MRHSLDRKVCNTLNVCCIVRSRAHDLVPAFRAAAADAAATRGVEPIIHDLTVDNPCLAHEWEWDTVPEVGLLIVDDVAQAVQQCNRYSPHFVASLVAGSDAERGRRRRRRGGRAELLTQPEDRQAEHEYES